MKVYDSQGRLKVVGFTGPPGTQSVTSTELSNVQSVLAAAINVVSNGLSNLTSIHDVLSNRVSANSATGGAGSVTSTEASAISAQAASAIASEVSNRVSADNVLSVAINVVSNAVSAVEVHASTASAAATSADAHANTVSARVVSVSAELTSLVQIASAAATSADTHANTASAAATSADAHANTVSARVVSVSAELASLVQIASAAATSADAHANTASAAATSVDGRIASLSAALASISVRSVGDVSTHGLQSAFNALSNRISGVTGGTGSVTSTELSAAVEGLKFLNLTNEDNAAVSAGGPVFLVASATSAFHLATNVGNPGDQDAVGLATSLIGIGSVGVVQTRGVLSLTSAQWDDTTGQTGGLTTGSKYYVNIAGKLTVTPPVSGFIRPVGTAIAPTKMLVNPGLVDDFGPFLASISALSTDGSSVKGLQSAVNALSGKINFVSNAASIADVHASTASAAATSVNAHVNTVSARVVSVSAELVSLVQIASAAATSADGHANTASAAATSADGHANTASAAATSADAHANTASAAATSVDGRVTSVNAFISGISARSAGNVSTHGFQSVVNALSGRIDAVTGGSVTSNELSAASAQAASAINVVSARVVSVSAELASLVQIASAAATSADAHANTASAAATSVDARVNSVNVFISGISALSVGGISTHGLQSVVNALSNRISAVVAGAASVTSTEASAISATAAANLSADHFISLQNVDTVSLVYGMPVIVFTSANTMRRSRVSPWDSASAQAFGLVADAAIAVSAVGRVQYRGTMPFTSAQTRSIASGASAFTIGGIYNVTGVGVIGTAHTTGNFGITRIGVALDTRTLLLQVGGYPVDQNLSDKISILSQTVSVLSTQVTSINTALSGVSALSAGGASTHGLQSIINALSNRISAVVGGTGSVTSTELSAVSAQANSAINVVSARVVSVSAELASLVQIASAAATSVNSRATSINARLDAVSAASVGASVQGLQSALDALSNTASNEASVRAAISANVTSLQSTVSHLASIVSLVSTVSGAGTAVGLQSVINALSNRISAIPGAGSVNAVAFVSVAQVICAAALTNISGMTVSVSTGVLYELRGQIMYSVSAATGNGFGLTFPAMTNAAGDIWGVRSVNPTSAVSGFSLYVPGAFDGGDSGSIVWSCDATGTAGLHVVHIAGTFLVSTGGVIVPGARASVATNAVTIARGSWMRVFKLS